MDENTNTLDTNKYQTYEYLVSNSVENDHENFYVVQENGTLYISKQVEYVNGVESCVYDVPSQQFFVDVNNSTELITVPDNFALPTGEHNIYANSFLLQTIPSTSTTEIEPNKNVNQCKTTEPEEVVHIENNEIRQNNNCTEITISDEQYNILEKEGWILLDVNDKVFILDTLGLHDITNNKELIQQSRQAIKTIKQSLNIKPNIISHQQVSSNQLESVELVINDELLNVTNTLDVIVVGNQKQGESKTKLAPKNKTEAIITEPKSPIRLKTNLLLKDIPDKIDFGTTINGKKLVAKFHKKPDLKTRKAKNSLIDTQSSTGTHTLCEWQFSGLIKKVTSHGAKDENKCNTENLISINDIIGQLLMQNAFQTAVMNENLVITKTIRSKVGEVENEVLLPWIVGGQVTNLNGQLRFVLKPNMLEELMNDPETSEVTHLHIIETIGDVKKSEKISVTLNKRRLPPKCKAKRQVNKAFACSCCAKIFQSKDELLKHEEEMLMETDDPLTIDTDRLQTCSDDKANSKPTPDANGYYTCNNCPMKFTRFSNFKKHAKSHSKEGENGVDMEPKYKCKICPSAYYYSSTLSKHIVTVHIKGSKRL